MGSERFDAMMAAYPGSDPELVMYVLKLEDRLVPASVPTEGEKGDVAALQWLIDQLEASASVIGGVALELRGLGSEDAARRIFSALDSVRQTIEEHRDDILTAPAVPREPDAWTAPSLVERFRETGELPVYRLPTATRSIEVYFGRRPVERSDITFSEELSRRSLAEHMMMREAEASAGIAMDGERSEDDG